MGGLEELFAKLFSRVGARAFSEYGVIGIVSVLVAYFLLLSASKVAWYSFGRREELRTWFRTIGAAVRGKHRHMNSEAIHSIICAAALLIAAFSQWPYFIYVLLRLFICCSSAYIAAKSYSRHRVPLTWLFGAVAVLFNPVLPVRMARSDWAATNAVTALFFIAFSAYLIWDSQFRRRVRQPRHTAEVVLAAAAICDEIGGHDTRILELDPTDTTLSDFFVVTSAANRPQVIAIADEIGVRLKHDFGLCANVEGSSSDWILLDYIEFVIHIFLAEKRGFYDIERLRKSAKSFTPVEFDKEVKLEFHHS